MARDAAVDVSGSLTLPNPKYLTPDLFVYMTRLIWLLQIVNLNLQLNTICYMFVLGCFSILGGSGTGVGLCRGPGLGRILYLPLYRSRELLSIGLLIGKC